MSEHLLKIFLDEVGRIRLECAGCNAVIEDSITAFEAPANPSCPMCGKPFFSGHKTDTPLQQFAKAIGILRTHQTAVKVQFVLPVKD